MPPSELTERELERRIAEKERDIGHDLALIRANARQLSTTATQVAVGGAVLLGAFLLMRVFRYARQPRLTLRWPGGRKRLLGRRVSAF